MNLRGITRDTIARTIILLVALINQVMAVLGVPALPIEADAVYTLVSTAGTIFAAVWAWWKNNSLTSEAQEADNILKRLKNEDLNKH